MMLLGDWRSIDPFKDNGLNRGLNWSRHRHCRAIQRVHQGEKHRANQKENNIVQSKRLTRLQSHWCDTHQLALPKKRQLR
jgi:hypothetical protein